MLRDLVLKNRSYRGFDESVRISRETLEVFVDCARLCPSSVNKQPLKYFLAWEPEEVEKVQGLTKWARALPDMVLPHPGKRPVCGSRGAQPRHHPDELKSRADSRRPRLVVRLYQL